MNIKPDVKPKTEHILVCLSSSPSNAKIIKTAAKMAKAFDGKLTALYVKTPDADTMSEADRERLAENFGIAESFGAEISTVFGESIAHQIAEFARFSAVTKLVIGRSGPSKKSFFSRPSLTEQLIALSPSLDIYIIPDSDSVSHGKRKFLKKRSVLSHIHDIAISLLTVLVASVFAHIFFELGFTDANVITVYILAVLVSSLLTESRIGWMISSFASIIIFNFFFTLPKYELPSYKDGYLVTLIIMLIASVVTGSFAKKIKNHSKESARLAYRAKILFDTNQLISRAENISEIAEGTAKQVKKLTASDVIIYTGAGDTPDISFQSTDKIKAQINEEALAFSLKMCEKTGAWTDFFSELEYQIIPIESNREVWGAAVILKGGRIDPFENSILSSILGECALALKNANAEKEKREADIRAENEKLRANLLRAISHDLRTPLTSISGNADNLISNAAAFDEEMKARIYKDIYDDSMWLVNLVENLLSVTRIDEGRMNINMREELVDEVIQEALGHIGRKSEKYIIKTDFGDEILLAKMDARLIIQLVVNLVDNALKYTPCGSEIEIRSWREGGMVLVSVADNGAGIPDEMKPRVFEMFYTGGTVADGRRSLGLGLSLCKSIVNAHGGDITLSDNTPHGAVFTFTLQEGTAVIHE